MVEHNNSTRYTNNKGKRKHHDNIRADPNKKAKPTCWKCGKTGHIKRDCKGVNVGSKTNSSDISGSWNSLVPLKGYNMFNKSLRVYYVTYVSESNYVPDDEVAWWVDFRATIHYETRPGTVTQRVWGCRAVVRLPDPKLKTLGERGNEPNESVSINSIIKSKDVILDENIFSPVPRPSQRSLINETKDIGSSVVNEDVTEEVVVQQPEPELRKGKRN
ncbi:zinc finger, CCHC-type containing protein [Tanacetum coccineum]